MIKGEYIFVKNSTVIIYYNENDSRLSTDENAKLAFEKMEFEEKIDNSVVDSRKNASIAFLHGGTTAEEIQDGDPITGGWPSKTLFVLFSSQGFHGREPIKTMGSNNAEHLVVFIQKAPLNNSFGVGSWKKVINWSLSVREKLVNSSVDEILDAYNTEEWIKEVVPQEDYPENLLALYLLDVAMAMPEKEDFKERLRKPQKAILHDIEEDAKKEFRALGGDENNWTDLNTRVAAIREALCRSAEQTAG